MVLLQTQSRRCSIFSSCSLADYDNEMEPREAIRNLHRIPMMNDAVEIKFESKSVGTSRENSHVKWSRIDI